MGIRIGYRQIDEFLIVCLYSSSKLTVFAHKSKWWQAIVDEPELDTLAGRAKSSLDQFVNKLFDALANSEEKAFAVREESSGSIKLIWSKEAKKGLQLNFGSFILHPVDTNDSSGSKALDQLLSNILGQWGSFQSRCRDLELDNKRLHELGSEAVEKYEKLISDLQDRESAILNTCAKLLNEKKRKISSLMISFESTRTELDSEPLEKVVSEVATCSDQTSSPQRTLVNPSVELDDVGEYLVDEEGDDDDLLPKVRKTHSLSSARKPRSVRASSSSSRDSASNR